MRQVLAFTSSASRYFRSTAKDQNPFSPLQRVEPHNGGYRIARRSRQLSPKRRSGTRPGPVVLSGWGYLSQDRAAYEMTSVGRRSEAFVGALGGRAHCESDLVPTRSSVPRLLDHFSLAPGRLLELGSQSGQLVKRPQPRVSGGVWARTSIGASTGVCRYRLVVLGLSAASSHRSVFPGLVL